MEDIEVDKEIHAVEIQAEVRKITSMADGSYNIVLNVGEDMLDQTQEMMGWIRELVTAVIVRE
jgi:hypothetical protein